MAAIAQVLAKPPKGLFWSAPPAADTDFTPEDPLALDYLGQQVGNWLFGGFTTRTSRAQNYAVVAYGLRLAQEAIWHYGYAADDATRTQLFERWERFWALATMEYREGQLARGDEDSMRGVRGAARAWSPGEKALPLDFPLISRQSELGGLGAYLSSLREYGLVFPGTLRVTPAAEPLLQEFWSPPGKRDTRHLYAAYALRALELDRSTIERRCGKITLATIGRRTRLSALYRADDSAWAARQKQRLWQSLFEGARDGSTLPLAERLIAASHEGVIDPEELLVGFLDGRWGELDGSVAAVVEVALAFGRVARELLSSFDRAYGYVDQHGWVADMETVAEAAFSDAELERIRPLCKRLLETAEAARFPYVPG